MPVSTNSTSVPESSPASSSSDSTGPGTTGPQPQQQLSSSASGVNDSSQVSQQQQPTSHSVASSTSSLASRILAPFLRFTSSSSVAVPSGLPSPSTAAGTSSSEKSTSATSSASGTELSPTPPADQHASQEPGENSEQIQRHKPCLPGGSADDASIPPQSIVAFDDQPVVQQTAPLGVTEYLLLETLSRTITAKAAWSHAVSAAQSTAASLNLTDPVAPTLVILEQDCEDPWTQADAIRQVEVVIRPDIFMSVASTAKLVDHAATVFMRMLNKYRLAKVMAEAMDMTSIDPMPWQRISLHVLREHLLGYFTHQPSRIPFNGFGRAIAVAAAPTSTPDSDPTGLTIIDIDGGGGESEAASSSVHRRCASAASDASSSSSCASPNVRRLGSGLVGSSMPTPALLTSRESHLDRRPTSLVNYNNSSTARNKYVSPPSSTVALNHPEAHLLVRNSTPVPYTRPQSPVSELHARVAHPKPRKLTLSIPNARTAPRPAPAEFSPLIFDKNRYIRPGGAPVALHSDSPLATPLPSPGPSSSANMGIALPAAAANAGLMLADEVMRAMAANGGRLSRPTTPARAMSGSDGSSGNGGGAGMDGSSSSNKSQAV
ncbi:hypothetical protein BCR44DRAFT_163891 [Catenaria anguillulae PL171]|uniref:Uncharacterized protein n=1 Tax=Catenaria anguillulae PL171 TaxID=765915 RepID=A0A1Y2H813_9FUNG|nr:hypothetical protein BCR44DRAFT_163891 [Catenaria anguillulae PL171]